MKSSIRFDWHLAIQDGRPTIRIKSMGKEKKQQQEEYRERKRGRGGEEGRGEEEGEKDAKNVSCLHRFYKWI